MGTIAIAAAIRTMRIAMRAVAAVSNAAALIVEIAVPISGSNSATAIAIAGITAGTDIGTGTKIDEHHERAGHSRSFSFAQPPLFLHSADVRADGPPAIGRSW